MKTCKSLILCAIALMASACCTSDKLYKDLPFQMEKVQAPRIPSRSVSLLDFGGVPVICYGLRTDFSSSLFPGSMRLMELADKIEEIPTVCWCGRRAHFNARIADGRIVREGEQVFIGANESYISLCRRHFKEGRLSG